MAFTLTVDQQVSLSVAYVDSQGNPAQVDGVPVWASSDTNVATVLAAADGLSAVAAAAGNIGTAQISVTADADLGAGTTSLISLLDLAVVGGEAVSGTITPGEPEPILSVQPVSP